MTGTSVDGIDISYLKTNGTNYVKKKFGKTFKYNRKYKNKVLKFIKNINKNNRVKLDKINYLVSNEILKFLVSFLSNVK